MVVLRRSFWGLGAAVTGVWLALAGGSLLTECACGADEPDAHVAVEAAEPAHGEPVGADTHAAGPGHHNPYDLSHANPGDKLEDPTEWRFDMALCTLAVFILLLGLLAKFAWGPILMGLNRREQAIIARIEAAKASADEAAAQLAEYRAKLAAAGQEAQELLAKARRDGEASADAIRRAAQDAAARERDRAIADIQAAKNAAVAEIGRHGADLAVKLAGRIVRRELSPQDHSALIAEALEKFPSRN
jgi:F-type H+-transporting ATPase subunit b